MNNKTARNIFFRAALCALVTGMPVAEAHHAFATSFDVNQPVELRGKVSKVELINPHSWIHIDVADADGTTSTWRIEGGSPNALFRNGITKNSVPIGAELHIVGYKARDGSLRAVGRDITFSDGRPLFFGGSQAPGQGPEN
jgi:hypothetical protein